MSGTLPTKPGFKEATLTSNQTVIKSISESGKRQSRIVGGHLWEIKANYPEMARSTFAPVFAFCVKQRGDSFQITLPNFVPQGSATGTIDVVGTHSAGDTDIAIDGIVSAIGSVINGAFDTDSDWSKGTGWSISSGVARCNASQTAATSIASDEDISVEAGESYTALVTISNYVAGSVSFDILGGLQAFLGVSAIHAIGSEVGLWLADTTAETVAGTGDINLISRPEQLDNAVWIKTRLTVTANQGVDSDGNLSGDKLVSNGTADPYLYFNYDYGSPIASKTFTFTAELWTDDGQPVDCSMRMFDVGPTEYGLESHTITATPTRYTVTHTFSAGAAGNKVNFRIDPPNSGVNGDYIYVTKCHGSETATERNYASSFDLSSNDHAIEVVGTLTKAPVATGSELVAYSGFGLSNYLQQSYNANMNFGTGDFACIGWVYMTSYDFEQFIERNDLSASGGFFRLRANDTTGTLYFRAGSSSAVHISLTSSAAIQLNTWTQVVCLRRSGVMELYLNGVLDSTLSNTLNVSNSSAVVKLGIRSDGAIAADYSSLAAWRILSTAPIATQIQAIYEAELNIFRNPLYTADGTYKHTFTASQNGKMKLTGNADFDANIDDVSLNKAGALKAGDIVKFSSHSKVYMATDDLEEISGTLSITPPLIEALAGNEVVTIENVPFTVAFEDDPQEFKTNRNSFSTFSIDLIEHIE